MARLREAFIDGLLLALPLVVVVLILAQVIGVIRKVSAPIAKQLPNLGVFGVTLVDLVAIVVLVLLLIALGAFARSSLGKRVSEKLERVVLKKIPGFLFFKSMAVGFGKDRDDEGMTPVLVSFDDNTVLGFIVEQNNDDDLVTVFVPSAPTPVAGTVYLLPRSRLQVLDIPTRQAVTTVVRLGVGLKELLPSGRVRQPSQSA